MSKTLDDLFDLWAEDSKIDRTELGEESIKIPQLHHKYYKLFSIERLGMVKLQEDLRMLKKDLFEYYNGKNQYPFLATKILFEGVWGKLPLILVT